jgi:hypothetical protein
MTSKLFQTTIFLALTTLCAQDKPAGVPVHLVVSVQADSKKPVPTLNKEDVIVKQGKDRLPVAEWIPAKGDQAAMQLFLLIDDTCDTSLGTQLSDLKEFIAAQPATTVVAIGYMRNTTVTIAQNFTADKELATKAMRLPLGGMGATDSPYLSVVDLVKRWPASNLRREVIMVTDGIDRLRNMSGPSMGAPVGRAGMGRGMTTMPTFSPDVDTASSVAQRYGVIIHTIYWRGVGHMSRNYWEANMGQNSISKLSDETGGESYFLGLQDAVSFKPYLEELQKVLNNQYYLVFRAKPGKNDGLQRVKLSTEVAGAEIVSADNVWVPSK